MYLRGLDGPQMNHPFWRGDFLIKDEQMLREVQTCGAEHCWIDVFKREDAPVADESAPEPVPQPVPEAAPTAAPVEAPKAQRPSKPKPERVSFEDELVRAKRLRARSVETMRQLFDQVRFGNAIDPAPCVELVDDVVASIDRQPHALTSLIRLKTADEYTYVHSVAVCALMVALGRQLGLDDEQCREAGLAGMLHDLGKAVMPHEILNKPGKLTPEEFDIIKQHPRRGYELLIANQQTEGGITDVCLHHHERIDGTGYPDRLSGERISLFARMGAVCDVYDAVTSDRPYKAGWDPAHALSQMATWQGHFDRAIFESFVKCLGIYPTGSLVRMRSGKLAIVVDQNPASLTRPRVKVFFSTKAGMPLPPKLIDLALPNVSDQIECRESPENWEFPYLNDLWIGASAD
jgi:HD-GYP domain-containing protein (c-di-GMP phosphodiesterase class II)